jgi:hypothetical protein
MQMQKKDRASRDTGRAGHVRLCGKHRNLQQQTAWSIHARPPEKTKLEVTKVTFQPA